MKTSDQVLVLIVILLSASAAAQSVDPIAYGKRYCLLRSLGVDSDAAMQLAIRYSYSGTRSAANLSADTAAAAKYVFSTCPDR